MNSITGGDAMKFGGSADFEVIAQAATAMILAQEHQDKALLAAAVSLLKNRDLAKSPIAVAVGNTLETELRKYGMI
jgi:hypothetical protein